MSETLEGLRRQIDSATKLGSVVRTMKAMAASNIGHYEQAVASLAAYRRTLELAIAACLRTPGYSAGSARRAGSATQGVVAFGSDQGLVGDFNERLALAILRHREAAPGPRLVWVVGARLAVALEEVGLQPRLCLPGASGIDAVAPLVGELLLAVEQARSGGEVHAVHVFANEPGGARGYRPAMQRLLPLDRVWREDVLMRSWPTRALPEVLGGSNANLPQLVRQHLFAAVYAACARALAAENTSRLLAMQRAERNIDELLDDLSRRFHRERQSGIDAELFDLVAGFETLGRPRR